MSKVNYKKIRQDNIEEYGKGIRHLSYFADIYSTRTHFIFEILQNAEDALSRRPLPNASGYVRFHLHSDKLEICHNGKPFDELDIIGICGIGGGTKGGDYTQIGKFGIGFKSVYAYSFFPEIHSETEHFKISRFVEPHEIEARNSQDTLIVLPFDQPDTRPKWAFRGDVTANDAELEIRRAITKLNIRTLLFLKQIETIEWILPNGEQGCLTKKIEDENLEHDALLVNVKDHQGKQEQWRIFTRAIVVKEGEKEQQATVEVAFLLDKNGKVMKATDTELVISFPTEKKTGLGFLIQAPFKATKSRDNIKSDDPANDQMIQAAAELAADSLAILRDMGCLAVDSYNALPLNKKDFSENSFRPIYDRIYDALKNQDLLPVHDGSFIKADQAKLARGKELVELFSSEQLGALFGKQSLTWLDASITPDNYRELHDYLMALVEGIQVTPDSLKTKLTPEFLKSQPIDWLIKFILYVESAQKTLKETSFIRLESGEQVALSENKVAWFAPEQAEAMDLSVFPLVHADLVNNEAVRKFLSKEGVCEIDAVDLVIKSVLPKYKNPPEFEISIYLNDLEQISKAYSGNDGAKQKLEIELSSIDWLACVEAGANPENSVVWKRPIKNNCGGRTSGENDLFAKPENLEISFSELEGSKIYFLQPLFEEQFKADSLFKTYLAEKVRPLDEKAIVEKVILPKYKAGDRAFDEQEYRADLQWIFKAFKALTVPVLKDTPWVACIHASNNMPNEIVWKKPNLTIYERNNDFETWFSGLINVDAYFLHTSVKDEVFEQEQLKNLVKPLNELTKNLEAFTLEPVILWDDWRDHKHGIKGFRPDAEIMFLKEVLEVWNIERFKIFWGILLNSPRIICGETQQAASKAKLNYAGKKREYTSVGNLCRETNCIPDKQGNWHKPKELCLHDLPDEFDTESVYAKDIAEKLGMKKTEVQEAINIIAGDDPIKVARINRFLSASDEEQEKMCDTIPQEIPPQPAPPFKGGLENLFRPQRCSSSTSTTDKSTYPLNNPERYQNKINQEIDEKITLHETTLQTIRFSLVRESSSNQKARDFLYEEYQGKCQITGNTFLKASANADNYFEACALLSYSNADYLNDVGNMLCVSADTMAKLKNASFEWLDDLAPIIEHFKNRQPKDIENVKAKIKLACFLWRRRIKCNGNLHRQCSRWN